MKKNEALLGILLLLISVYRLKVLNSSLTFVLCLCNTATLPVKERVSNGSFL